MKKFHPLLGVGQLVAFDLETTGLREKGNQITQIAAVKMGGFRMAIEDTFSTYVNPGIPIPERIQKLTKVTDELVESAPPPIEGLQHFSDFAGNAVLFGHDIYRFDFKFIRKTMNGCNDKRRNIRFIDTMDIFEALWPDFSRLRYGLDYIAERLSAGLSQIRRHNALGDAMLLAQIFHRIQTYPDLESYIHMIPVHEAELPALTKCALESKLRMPTPTWKLRLESSPNALSRNEGFAKPAPLPQGSAN